jgi:hypothetical protein
MGNATLIAASQNKGARKLIYSDPPTSGGQVAKESLIQGFGCIEDFVLDLNVATFLPQGCNMLIQFLQVGFPRRFSHEGDQLAGFHVSQGGDAFQWHLELNRVQYMEKEHIIAPMVKETKRFANLLRFFV